MIKLGDLLKSKRREKGLTISQVSDIIKIPQNLVRALENGNYDAFASEVYLKGFLKNYAKFLGIEENKALAIFRRDREAKEDNTLKETKTAIKETKAIITPGRLVLAATLIIVIAVISFIAIQINVIMQPPKLTLEEPVEAIAPAEVIKEIETDTIILTGKVEVGSKLLINGNEVTTNNLQEFRVDNYKLQEGSNKIQIVAQSYYFSKTSEIDLTVIVKKSAETGEDDNAAASVDGQTTEGMTNGKVSEMELKIEMLDEEAWVDLTVDGVTKISDVLKPGQSFEYTAKKQFTIYSPRPQMVKLTINGEEFSFSSQIENIFKLKDGEIMQE